MPEDGVAPEPDTPEPKTSDPATSPSDQRRSDRRRADRESSGRQRPGRRRSDRQRPGRFRRWVLRPLFWGLAIIACLIFLGQLLVDTPRARQWARQWLSAKLTTSLERPVEIREVSFELLPFSIEVWGLTIGGVGKDQNEGDGDSIDGGEERPFLHVPWAEIEADLSTLRQRRLHLRRVRVERPEVFLQFYSDGDNLIRSGKRDASRRPFEVWIDRVEIDQAVVVLDEQRIRLSLDAETVRSRLRGLGDLRLAGDVLAQQVHLELPNARPMTVTVAAQGEITRGGLLLSEAEITSTNGLAVTSNGECTWRRQRESGKCWFRADGTARGETLADLGYFEDLSGEFAFDGRADWRPGSFGWRSEVTADSLVLWQRQLQGLRGQLTADRYASNLRIEQLQYAAGSLEGNLLIETRDTQNPMSLDLQFQQLAIEDLLADQNLDITGLASRAQGQISYNCPLRSCRAGDGRGEIALVPDPAASGLQLEGTFPLRIDQGIIAVETASLRADRQSLLISGLYDLDARRGRYDFTVETADLAQLTPLLPGGQDPEPSYWLPSAGSGHLDGTLYLEPSGPSCDLRLALNDVVTSRLDAAQVSGGLTVSAQAVDPLRLDFGGGEQALSLSGRIPLRPTGGDLQLTFDAFAWPMTEVHPWLPFKLPLGGTVSGRMQLAIQDEISSGRLNAAVASAEFSGLPLDSVATRMHWQGGAVNFDLLQVVSPSGTLAGWGNWLAPDGALELHMESPRLDLQKAPLRAHLPRDDLQGVMAASARVSGTLAAPELELTASAEALSIAGRPLTGESRLEARWLNNDVDLEARLFDAVYLTGGGDLDAASGQTDVELKLEGSDLGGLIQLFAEPPTEIDGEFAGRLRVRGRLAAGQPPPRLDVEFDSLEARLLDRRLTASQPIKILFAPDDWTIEAFRLVEAASQSALALRGTLGYGLETPLDLALQAQLDTDWLRHAMPDLKVSGRFDLDGRLTGSWNAPQLDGLGELSDGSLVLPNLPYPITELSGAVRLLPDRLQLDNLTGQFADGELTIGGRATPPWQATEFDYQLRLTGRDLDLSHFFGWSVAGNTDLAMRSVAGGHLIDGRADLTRIDYREDFRIDFAQLMSDFLRRRRLEVDPASNLLSTMRLNVQVTAPDAVTVENNLATLAGSADLTLRGDLAQPIVFGQIDVNEGGRLRYNGNDFGIERGRLLFADPYQLNPEVDLVATTRVREIDVDLSLAGTLDRLETRFSSEPPLPDVEVLRLLSGGEVFQDTALVAPTRADRIGDDESGSAASFLYGQAASVIGDRVNSLFGFDKFRIDPLTGSGDNLSKARVTVGKRLSKDLFLTYSANPSSNEDQRLQIEWQVTDGLVLVLTQNGDDTYSADARFESTF